MSLQRDFSGKSAEALSSNGASGPNSPNNGDPSSVSEEEYSLLKVIVYDKHTNATHLKITRSNVARDVCKNMSVRLNIDKNDAKFYTLVLSITTIDPVRRTNIHSIRTLQPEEAVLVVLDDIVNKLGEKYQVTDLSRLRTAACWYFKDPRSGPIDFNDAGNIIGEYSSDEEEEMSPSDLLYFSKADRKGYLLKRSNKDINVWKRWYCVLTDHMWCIDPNRDIPKAICIRLSGVVRSKEGISYSEQIQNIIVNSPKGTHLFRAFNVLDQRTWMEELTTFANRAIDNEYFSMAEVIIQDEEQSKTRRFRKVLEKMLSLPPLLEAMQIDHRKAPRSRQNSATNSLDLNPTNDEETDGKEESEVIKTVWEQQRKSSFGNVDNNNKTGLERKSSYSVFSDHSPDDLQQSQQAQNNNNNSNCIPYMVHPLDRTMLSPIGHRLHLYEHLLTHYLAFLLDVLAYKELFRHDLFYTLRDQKKRAVKIVIMHLVPQARHHVLPLPRYLITASMTYKQLQQEQQELRDQSLSSLSSKQVAKSMLQERNIRFPLIHRLRSNFGQSPSQPQKNANSRPSTSERTKSGSESVLDEFWGLSKSGLEKLMLTLFGDQQQQQSVTASAINSPQQQAKNGGGSSNTTPVTGSGKAGNRQSAGGLGGFFNIFSSSSNANANNDKTPPAATEGGHSSLTNGKSSRLSTSPVTSSTVNGNTASNSNKVRIGAGKVKFPNSISNNSPPAMTSQTKGGDGDEGSEDDDEDEYGSYHSTVVVSAELFDELVGEIITLLSPQSYQQQQTGQDQQQQEQGQLKEEGER